MDLARSELQDAECLRTRYATHIDESQRLPASLSRGARHAPSAEVEVDVNAHSDRSTLQRTAAKPALVVSEQCASVIAQSGERWSYLPRDADWLCDVATLEAKDVAPLQSHSAMPTQMRMQPQVRVPASTGQ